MDRRGSYARRAGIVSRYVVRDERHLVRMAVTDRTVSSTVLNRCWCTASGVELSASTVRRSILRARLVDRMPFRLLSLSRNHQRLRLKRARERSHRRAEWQNLVFRDEFRFNLSYNDAHIRVRLVVVNCIADRHSGHLANKKVLFHHDNAPAHTSAVATAKLHYELLPHPPYSPDLALCDFFLFPNLKKSLARQKFESSVKVIAATEAYFADLEKTYFQVS